MFWVKFYMISGIFGHWGVKIGIFGLITESFLGIGELKLGFLVKNGHKAVATQFFSP